MCVKLIWCEHPRGGYRPSAVLHSSFVIAAYCMSTPHSSWFRAPCIWTFFNSLPTSGYSDRLL